MEEPIAIRVAQDVVRQLMTVATGVVGLSLTFRTNLVTGNANEALIEASWVLFTTSVVAGFGFQLSYTGVLNDKNADASLESLGLRLPWLIQCLSFIAGLILLVGYGFAAF